MKNRSRPFSCTIAGKIVNISLRHGGGLQEPDNVYVRCDERDCQHVDLNTPPCPLHVGMFADGSDRLVADYLQTRAGTAICYACLTEALGVTHDQVRRASWRLKEEASVSIRPSRCGVCRHRRVTIGVARGGVLAPPDETPAVLAPAAESTDDGGELAAYLRSQPGFSFCAHCLARELNTPPSMMRDAMWALESQAAFHIRTTQCVSCLLSKPVIRYEERPSDVEAPRRIIELLLQSPGVGFCPTCVAFSTDLALGDVRRIFQALEPVQEFERRESECATCGRWQPTVRVRQGDLETGRASQMSDVLGGGFHHRGYRVALLSFRTAEGWRPFALVKSAKGAHVVDAPPILLGLMPTKLEADELVASQAREWIDKRAG